MALSVTTTAASQRLTRVKAIQDELGITGDHALLERFIDFASAAIASHCHWPRGFGRQVYSATVPGFGDIHLQLPERPIVAVSSVTYDGQTLTDYSVADRDRGLLYRQAGWDWTSQQYQGLTGWQGWPGRGVPLPGQEEPLFTVAFTGGYILPSEHLDEVPIAAVATGSKFTSAGSLFPPRLVAGDVVETSGFQDAANNGRFVVTGTPTTAEIVVSGTLVDETANNRTMRFRNFPDMRAIDDLELAAIQTAKGLYEARKDDPRLIEKQLGPARLRWSELESVQSYGIPAQVVGLLRPWRRAA